MKIAILTDSCSGMNQKESSEWGIYYLPLQIVCQEAQYLDGISIELQELYELLRKGEQMTTSMPPIALIDSTLDQIKADGYDTIICVPITSGLSSTASMIGATAKEKGLNLYIVDCFSTCYLQCYLAQCAKRLADQGLDAETIVARLQASIASSNTLIIPDDLQHLKKGGRLTPMAAALGGLLKIKPILQLNQSCEGKIDVYDKVRTMAKAQGKAIDTFVQEHVGEDYILSCLHTDAMSEGLLLQEKMKAALPHCKIYFGYIGAVISVHTGIGCLGIQYIKRVEGCE